LTNSIQALQKLKLMRLVDKGEELVLCLLLFVMIVLACIQIILRTFFDSGLLWADPLLRYLVIWCGLLGAVAATGQGKHIALDLTGKHLSTTLRAWLDLTTYLFSTLAAFGLTWAGCRFLQNEIEFGGDGPFAIPLWFWNGIFPLAFGLIAMKYFVLLLLQTKNIILSAKPKDKGNR
jgi:TRAP-type C4-dicarboxylate transport system permease small subunit